MTVKAKRIDNLQRKIGEYKNKLVVKYLNANGYECSNTLESMKKVNEKLSAENKKVILQIENEKVFRNGSYYVWDAYVKVKIINVTTGEDV